MIFCKKTTRLVTPHSGVDYIGTQQRVSCTYSSALKDADYASCTEEWCSDSMIKPLYFYFCLVAVALCATITVLVYI